MRIKRGTPLRSTTPLDQVLEYHDRTKHRLDKYAEGPEFLDWDLQPCAYRYFSGSDQIPLSLDLRGITVDYRSLYDSSENNVPINKDTLGVFLGLSLGLSAHKEYMGDRWALRCNPSSGNLHPTEAYVISSNTDGLQNGVYHYLSETHALQPRMLSNSQSDGTSVLVALSSIYWREAWKYGERAFRYCQLDAGHALAALTYSAQCLGWTLNVHESFSSAEISALCGIDRPEDYENAESEKADLLIELRPYDSSKKSLKKADLEKLYANGIWQGKANRLDRHPMYAWPIIDQVSDASDLIPSGKNTIYNDLFPPLVPRDNHIKARQLIYGRRSAQHFDKQTCLSREEFYSLLDKCLIRNDTLPWSVLPTRFSFFTVLYVHRVNSLTPGLYLLANSGQSLQDLQSTLNQDFLWTKAANAPEHLPFYLLTNKDTGKFSKTVSCHQAIASDGVFAASIISEFLEPIKLYPMNYRKMHWQAGLLGQLLYLEAESFGLRGTGIGCFFDDSIHEMLGIHGQSHQVLYNFTMGGAYQDQRISTLPAYPHLDIHL